MNNVALHTKIELLPEHLKHQVLEYIDFLLIREDQISASKGSTKKATLKSKSPTPVHRKKPLKAGFLKGSFVMAPDFDASLDDFKEYM